jgi:predicted kinase
MVGLPGSGKDFYIGLNKKPGDIVISSDDIRAELGDVNDQTKNKLVFKIFYDRYKQALKTGKDIWINATNVSVKNRSRAIHMAKKYNYKTSAIVLTVPVEICIERDKNRDRTVGENVIEKFYFRFEPVSFEEGFDNIVNIQPDLAEHELEEER